MTEARRRHHRAAALAALAALTLAGCSAAPGEAPSASPSASADDGGATGDPTRLRQGEDLGGGGVSGLVAFVSDSLMQVQEADSQTAVTWTDDTAFGRTVTVGLDAVTVGSCVLAVTPAADADTAGAAASVTVSEPVDGECAAGFGGARGGGATGEMPEGFEPPERMAPPEGRELPEGGERPEGMMGGGAFGRLVSGRVTAVTGSTLTVEATDLDGPASGVTTETVVTDADTVVTTTVPVEATAVEVGLCASARGEPDTRGGMTATAITLSDPGADGCVVRTGPLRSSAGADDD